RDGSEFLESLDPHLALAAARMAKSQHLPNPSSFGLLNPTGQHLESFGSFGIYPREHHERRQPKIPAPGGQFLGSGRRRFRRHDGNRLAIAFPVRSAPGDILVTGRLKTRKRPLEAELRIAPGTGG